PYRQSIFCAIAFHMKNDWALRIANKIADTDAEAERRENKRKRDEGRVRQQAASDRKAIAEGCLGAWRDLRNSIKRLVAEVNAISGARVLRTETSPSDLIKISRNSRAIVLRLHEARGIIACSGFNGGEIDLLQAQFSPERLAKEIIESISR